MAVDLLGFSHICIAVSDAERSMAFYRDLFGFDVVFDVELEGDAMAAVTGEAGARGRMIGGLVAGTMIELLQLAHRTFEPGGTTRLGYTNISLSVPDLDEAHRRVVDAGHRPDQDPVEIAGVRMFFVRDPDGTPVELVEYPGGLRSSVELWRGATG